MVNVEDAKNCWEHWSCVKSIRDKCPVFINNYGQRCWFLRGCLPHPKQRFDNCADCSWYKHINQLPAN